MSLAAGMMLLLAAYNPRLLLMAGAGLAVGLILTSMRHLLRRGRRNSQEPVEPPNIGMELATRDAQPIRARALASGLKEARLIAGRHPWVATLLAASVIGLLGGIAVSMSQGVNQVGQPVVTVVPHYEGTATYQDDGWDVTDRLVFDNDSLDLVRRLAGTPTRPLSESGGIALLVDKLGLQGWSSNQVGTSIVFTRPRRVLARARLFPLSTVRSLPVLPPNMVVLPNGRRLYFAPAQHSKLTLATGPHVIGITTPAGIRTATVAGETFQIDLSTPVGEQVDVQTQLLSPLIRNEPGAMLGRLTAGELLKWVVLAIGAIFADEIKQLLRDLVRRLRGGLHLTVDQPSSLGQTIGGPHPPLEPTGPALAISRTSPDASLPSSGSSTAWEATDQRPCDHERSDDNSPPSAPGRAEEALALLGGCDFGVCPRFSGGLEVRVADVVADGLVDDSQGVTQGWWRRWAIRGQQWGQEPVVELGVEDREASALGGEHVGVAAG